MNFFKDALRELKHVVWPTHKETRQYMVLVLLILTSFGIYLFIFSNIFSESLFWLKNTLGSSSSTTINTDDIDLSDLGIISDEVEVTTDGSGSITINSDTASGVTVEDAQESSTGSVEE